jgi:ABC-type sulfate/molybdate transport systems ATPase subunit
MNKEQQEKLVDNLKRWQAIENGAISQTAKVMEATNNPLIRMVMEIIQRDSGTHYHVQQTIIDSLEKTNVLSPDDLAAVWDGIEEHIRIEKKTIELAKEALAAIEGSKSIVQEYLLRYLMIDEEKHDKLLADLDIIKKGMYPYA